MKNSAFTPGEARIAIGNAAEKAVKLGKYASEILKLANHIITENSLLPERGTGGGGDFPARISQSFEAVKTGMIGLRANVFLLYWTLSDPETLDGALTYYTAITSDFQEKYCSCFDGIDAKAAGGWLFVKLPLLWSRYNYYAKNVPHYVKSPDYLRWFDRELDAALLKISDDIPTALYRHFSFLHVIPKNKKSFVDSDNYDTKHITDVIASHLTGTDGALNNSFSSFSMREGSLPVGSYAVVSPTFGAPPSLPSLVTTISAVFSFEKTD